MIISEEMMRKISKKNDEKFTKDFFINKTLELKPTPPKAGFYQPASVSPKIVVEETAREIQKALNEISEQLKDLKLNNFELIFESIARTILDLESLTNTMQKTDLQLSEFDKGSLSFDLNILLTTHCIVDNLKKIRMSDMNKQKCEDILNYLSVLVGLKSPVIEKSYNP